MNDYDYTGMAPDREFRRTQLDRGGMTTPADAIAHGVSVEATARAIARTWVDRYGEQGARYLADAMFHEIATVAREARDLANDARKAGL